MNEQIREKWLGALRGGNYRQGRHRLRQGDGPDGYAHCCLGVLIDVIDPPAWDREGGYTYPGEEIPDADLLSRAGLSLAQAYQLATMNDDGASFAEIAEVIENSFAQAG